ncbi:hypothetical protein APY04_0998 [Hyphomicrobium sulfonivorans]|uniref:Spermidine synthase n=1 Tax=Hyphomicrobium sulfonivorans TaxID=121290 RepID=A0A109BKS6_HYPSL|nr:hypothetical protein APY04_0998 [Hyphomicrobium sulfonivorans]
MVQQDNEAVNAGPSTLVAFAATTFLSAFLLFAIQPVFAKMVLPVLGGSSSVWAVALLFFQSALLAGYLYAHLLIRNVPSASTGFVHLAVALLALLVLPIGLPEGWNEPPPGNPYLWQLGLFTVAVGLPFFAVAANAPLLQAWFARSGHPHATDPYFLYGASNLGSLIALLGYPFLLEPTFGLTALSEYWTILYCVLIVAIGFCFLLVRRRAGSLEVKQQLAAEDAGPAPGWRDRAAWCGLAMIPAALLTAFTTHITTDVASAPLLWVLPLSLYLLTYVIAFQTRLPLPMWLLLPLQFGVVVFALLELSQTKHDTWTLTSVAGLAAFFLAALVAHRTLFLNRPKAHYLTEFYLWMSFGGVLGGLFAALIAPQLFSEVLEYPLLIALSLACRPGVFTTRTTPVRELIWLLGIFIVGAVIINNVPMWLVVNGYEFGEWGVTPVVALLFAAVAILFWRYRARQLVSVLLLFAVVAILPSAVKRGNAQRSYYGVYRVGQSADSEFNVFTHGTTLHGAQRIRDFKGNTVADVTPGTYYYPGSPMAKSVQIAQAKMDELGETGRFGVVGLGAGSLACYSRKHEQWRFFEIDPLVVDIASKSGHFTFLSNCQPHFDGVVGDARLTLEKEPDHSFDLLIIDAFTSDAVPVHLMTAEALQLYARKLTDNGVVVLHISNRYLDLEAVLGATLPLVPELKGLIVSDDDADGTYAQNSSTVAVFAKDMLALDPYRALPGAQDFHDGNVSAWTDDASDILGPFLSQRKRF